MANINLLPWRERLKEKRKKDFLVALAITVVAAGIIILLGDRIMRSSISNQNARNEVLREQILVLNKEIEEIRQLREQKAELTERMTVIQNLQGTRPVIVRLYDELVRTLPEGVYYNTVTRTNDVVSLNGVAESNNLVSALMRSLDDSEWFADPNLRQVNALPGGVNSAGAQESGQNQFDLTVKVTTPAQTAAAAEGAAQ
ncbi:MAG: PilN domain-containing protein [Dermatophilaceae bacterium]